jgi:DNA-directed RNA polymerase specialized sigma24 family protein
METPKAPISVDDLLLPLLQAEADDARHVIERLLVEHAGPLIKQIIRSKLSMFFGQEWSQDAEDLHGEVLVPLLARLQAFRSHPAENAIGNFRGYVAVSAYNACHEYIRRISPQYHQLKNRMRYLMTHHSDFSLWESGHSMTLCGFAKWREANRPGSNSPRFAQINDEPQSFAPVALGGRRPERMSLAELTSAIFDWLGHPVELDQMVTLVARLCGVIEPLAPKQSGRDEDSLDPFERIPDPRADVEAKVEARMRLEHIWIEIAQLPIGQRTALLLNLRDEKGGNAIALLPITGVASIRQIAEALTIPAIEFVHIWPRLPLDDDAIALRLGLTRQQVINLRLAARRRLLRRLRPAGERASAIQSERRA